MSGDILILNDTMDAGHRYQPFFTALGKKIIEDPAAFTLNPKRFSLVIFTGGSDVGPWLYGDSSPNNICWSDKKRDEEEVKIFHIAYNNNVAMFGICRGLQFLNVMCGGKLIHNLNNHHSSHGVSTSDGESFQVNSLHHQACILPMHAEILAWSTVKMSKTYVGDEDEPFDYSGPEVESAYYPLFKCAGVQWHPEALSEKISPRARTWAYTLARDIMNLVGEDAMRRLYYLKRPRINYVQSN